MGRKHEKYKFWQRHSNQVSVVRIARNCPRNQKLCTIAPKKWQKNENESFGDAPQTMYRWSRVNGNFPMNQKLQAIAQEKG
jgi:hypothetical protein